MTETVRKMKGDVNPLKVFYIALTVDNLDGSADVDWDGSQGYQEESLAIEHAVNVSEEHGSEFIICECIPIKRVSRPKPKVETLPRPKARK